MGDGAGLLAELLAGAAVFLHIAVCVLALGVLPTNRKPSSALSLIHI